MVTYYYDHLISKFESKDNKREENRKSINQKEGLYVPINFLRSSYSPFSYLISDHLKTLKLERIPS